MALRHIFISEDPYIFRLQLIKGTYWTIAGLITLLTIVNFVYNDSDGESLGGAFFMSIFLGLLLQIIFIPVYLVVKAITINYLVNLETNAPLQKNNDNEDKKYPKWLLPTSKLLSKTTKTELEPQVKTSKQSKEIIEVVKKFGCDAALSDIDTGPQIDTYHFTPEIGEKVEDPARLERAIGQTIGKNGVSVKVDEDLRGRFHIEVVRDERQIVYFKDLLESEEYLNNDAILPFIVGIDPKGKIVLSDLKTQPHMMMSGQTGSGKSVFGDTLLLSLLFNKTPDELKLILIDPKMVQMTPYNDIPHLLYPVITDPDKTMTAIKELVNEMENRFHILAESHTRNIEEYNDTKAGKMPYIVLVVDELADLMMMEPKDYEALLVRLMQKSRAVGIHIVYGSSRPSVDVFTGLLKANTPARVAFTTVSARDSQNIIDKEGAEKLLGRGDLLFRDWNNGGLIRAQAPFVSDTDLMSVLDYLRKNS